MSNATPIVTGGATLPAFSDAMRQSTNLAMPQGATQIIVVSGTYRGTSLGVCMRKCSRRTIPVCSAISVAAFAYLHPALTIERYQLGFLLLALGCNLSNLLVNTPMMVEMMMKRYKLQKDLGIGSEVGHSKNKELAKRSPALVAMNRKLRMMHVMSSLASLMLFGSLAMHSWYLSSKLNL